MYSTGVYRRNMWQSFYLSVVDRIVKRERCVPEPRQMLKDYKHCKNVKVENKTKITGICFTTK